MKKETHIYTVGELMDALASYERETQISVMHDSFPMPIELDEVCGELRIM